MLGTVREGKVVLLQRRRHGPASLCLPGKDLELHIRYVLVSEGFVDRFTTIYGIVLTCAIITFVAPIPAIAFMCVKSSRVLEGL